MTYGGLEKPLGYVFLQSCGFNEHKKQRDSFFVFTQQRKTE
jgi:hypothetical protein